MEKTFVKNGIIKKRSIILGVVLIFALSICACKKEIDPVAQKVMDDINSIGEVTLDDETLINGLIQTYGTLTDSQKEQVNNYATLLTAADTLNVLIEQDNKPIELTTSNIEDYININVQSGSATRRTKQGILTEYYYDFPVTATCSPSNNYYYEDVTLEIEWTMNWADATATYKVNLDGNGNGSYTYNQSMQASATTDTAFAFSIKNYKVKSVTGKVYKRNPNN